MIFLHVGHSKTGSSAIQSFLSLNRDLLAEYGVDYPAHRSDQKAAAGRISSGNVGLRDEWHQTILETIDQSESRNVLFSNENLIGRIRLNFEFLEAITSRHETKVVLYLRDPVDHMYSAYGQMIKRAGSFGGVDEYAREYRHPRNTLLVLQKIEERNIPLELRNYSRHKKDVIENFAEIILPEHHQEFMGRSTILDQPINRSMTLAEYELQKCFNQAYGRGASRFVSDKLVETLPDIPSERPQVNNETLSIMEENLARPIAAINKRLPEAEQLILQTEPLATDTVPSTTFSFSHEQLMALAESITSELRKKRPVSDKPASGDPA